MKVRCKRKSLSKEELDFLGYDKNQNVQFSLTVDATYNVLGVSLQFDTALNKGIVVLVCDDFERLAVVPLCLFEIIDSRISRYWLAKKNGAHNFLMWPEEFHADFFLDDVTEGISHAVEKFKGVCRKLDEEIFDEHSDSFDARPDLAGDDLKR